MPRVILASASPRRRELLSGVIEKFEIMVADVDESLPADVHPRDGVEILAVRQGAAIAADNPDAVVISSDTLVELGGVPLGKPTSREDACRMLGELSGNVHNVHTGVSVHYRGRVLSGVDSTAVFFREIGKEELLSYVEGGEPMDKAGAYGIQGEGGKFVTEIRGSFDTVVGLSVALTRRLIEDAIGGRIEDML